MILFEILENANCKQNIFCGGPTENNKPFYMKSEKYTLLI